MINPYKTLKQRKPVLTIKINYYADGMAIGYCWHHSIGDMSTFMELLKALSAFTQGKNYQKPVIPEDRENYLQQWQGKKIAIPKQNDSPELKCLGLVDALRFIKGICSSKRNFFIYFTQEEVASLRAAISDQAGQKFSRNDAVCAHLLDLIASCRSDQAAVHHASIIVNFRKRIGIPPNTLGNCVDALNLGFINPYSVNGAASTIHAALKNYLFNPSKTLDFVEQNGGIKKVGRMIPKAMLPQHKNLIITNWSNFEVYSIDFGVAAPILFMPIGESVLPWVSCIVEGFNNKGLFVVLVLPSTIAKRFANPAMLEKIHKYRDRLSPEDTAILKENSWCI